MNLLHCALLISIGAVGMFLALFGFIVWLAHRYTIILKPGGIVTVIRAGFCRAYREPKGED